MKEGSDMPMSVKKAEDLENYYFHILIVRQGTTVFHNKSQILVEGNLRSTRDF